MLKSHRHSRQEHTTEQEFPCPNFPKDYHMIISGVEFFKLTWEKMNCLGS